MESIHWLSGKVLQSWQLLATYEEAVQARLDAEKRLYDPFLAKYREENS